MRSRLLVLVAVAVVGLGGCSQGAPAPSQTTVTSRPAASVPADGAALSGLGFANGPVGFSVPAKAFVAERVDQPNVVTLVMTEPTGDVIASYLRAHLPDMGFTVTGDANASLTFTDGTWDGAFTSANGVSGLTLRKVA